MKSKKPTNKIKGLVALAIIIVISNATLIFMSGTRKEVLLIIAKNIVADDMIIIAWGVLNYVMQYFFMVFHAACLVYFIYEIKKLSLIGEMEYLASLRDPEIGFVTTKNAKLVTRIELALTAWTIILIIPNVIITFITIVKWKSLITIASSIINDDKIIPAWETINFIMPPILIECHIIYLIYFWSRIKNSSALEN